MWHFNYWYKVQVAHCLLHLSNRNVRVLETSKASWGYGETVWCCFSVCRQCGICFESCLLHTKLYYFVTFFKLWYGMILKSFLLITLLRTGTHFSSFFNALYLEWNILCQFFSYCSWGSQGKNTEVVCHSLLQWTTFSQISRSDKPLQYSCLENPMNSMKRTGIECFIPNTVH